MIEYFSTTFGIIGIGLIVMGTNIWLQGFLPTNIPPPRVAVSQLHFSPGVTNWIANLSLMNQGDTSANYRIYYYST